MNEGRGFPFVHEWLSDVDRSLAENLHRWADEEVMAKRLEFREDRERLLAPAMRKLWLDIGLQRLLWPERYGGDGHNSPAAAVTAAAALEQVARADTGTAFLLACTMALQSRIAMEPDPDDAVCEALAGLFSSGDALAVCSLVPAAFGQDPQASARPLRAGWEVNGRGVRPLNSGVDARVFCVLCALDGPEEEVGLIVVPADSKGIEVGGELRKTGLAADRNADIDLNRVEVPEAFCISRGWDGYRGLLSWLYLGLSASCVGALLACHEILREWGDSRVIKGRGQVFKENPLTASLMADVARETGISRMLTYDLARFLSRPETYGGEGNERGFVTAAMVNQQVCRSAEGAINNTMELMGSAGYAKEWNLERYWRDVKTIRSYVGPDQVQNMNLARYFYQCRTL